MQESEDKKKINERVYKLILKWKKDSEISQISQLDGSKIIIQKQYFIDAFSKKETKFENIENVHDIFDEKAKEQLLKLAKNNIQFSQIKKVVQKTKNISAQVRTFWELFDFEGNEYSYYVPPFQRNYSWTKIHLNEFFRYLKSSLETKRDLFLGTLTLAVPSDFDHKKQSIILIDGQQRVITLILFMFAFWFHWALDKKTNKTFFHSENHNRKIIGKIINSLYKNIDTEDEEESPKDTKETEEGEEVKEEADKENYKILIRCILNWQKEKLKINEEILNKKHIRNDKKILGVFVQIYCFLKKVAKEKKLMNFFDIILNQTLFSITTISKSNNHNLKEEHTLKIFETINATGKPLTLLDKIKNYLLFNYAYESQKKQEKILNKYWNKWRKKYCWNNLSKFNCFFNIICYIAFEHPKEKDSYQKPLNLEKKEFYNIFKFYFFEFDLQNNKNKDVKNIEKYFMHIDLLLSIFYFNLKNFKIKISIKDSVILNSFLFQEENKRNDLTCFNRSSFATWSFFFSVFWQRNQNLKESEYRELMRLTSTLEFILQIWRNKISKTVHQKYNTMINRIYKKIRTDPEDSDSTEVVDLMFKQPKEENNISLLTINSQDFFKIFAEVIDEKGKNTVSLCQMIKAKIIDIDDSKFIEEIDVQINRTFTEKDSRKQIYKGILEFVLDKDILKFEEEYDLEHIWSQNQKDEDIPEEEIESLGNLILFEKKKNNKLKNLSPKEKAKAYCEGKNKSKNPKFKLMCIKKVFDDWNPKSINVRKKEILMDFLNKLRKGLNPIFTKAQKNKKEE